MSKLIFRMKYADKKWPEYLTEVFGKEIADKCTIESDATALNYNARIKIDDFKNDKEFIAKLKTTRISSLHLPLIIIKQKKLSSNFIKNRK